MNTLNTENPNDYAYITKHLEIHILGGVRTNKLESMRVTLSIQRFDKLQRPSIQCTAPYHRPVQR